MTIREANRNDLTEILQLYLYLHEESIPKDTEHLQNTWESIINDVTYRFQGRKYIKFLSECWV